MQELILEVTNIAEGIDIIAARIYVNGRRTSAFTTQIPEHLIEEAEQMEKDNELYF